MSFSDWYNEADMPSKVDGLKAALELFDLIAAQKSAEQYDERIRKQAVAMPAHIAELMANGSPDAVKVANLMQVLLADMAAVGADTDDLVVRDLLRRQSTLRMNQGQAIAGRMVAFDSALDSAMMFDSSNSMIDVTVDPVGAFKALLGRFSALQDKKVKRTGKVEIQSLIQLSLSRSERDGNKLFSEIAPVSSSVADQVAAVIGEDVSGWVHGIDEAAVRHIIKRHGDQSIETTRNQIAIQPQDIANISLVLDDPDSVEDGGKASDGTKTIVLKKKIGDELLCLQEVRKGRKKLAVKTLWKVRVVPPTATEVGVVQTSETSNRNNPQVDPTIAQNPTDSSANEDAESEPTPSLLEKMKAKLARLEAEFNAIFDDMPFMGHGGTPYVDNSKGRQMRKVHDRRDERLRAKKAAIEVQKEAIERMAWRIDGRNTPTKKSQKILEKHPIHQGLFELEKQGLVKQWPRNPHFFFINGLDKVAIAAIDGKIGAMRRFPPKNPEEWARTKELIALASSYEKSALDSAQFDGLAMDSAEDPVAQMKALLARFDALGIIPTGRDNTVKTAKGTKVGTKFAIVEADRLITSHDANGKPNPKFPQELQPRDRERESSQAWVQKVSANLDPDSLGRTGRADSGAPIVGKDGIVESGNGRTMAIKLAYQRGTADEYRQFLMDDADYFGLDPDKIEVMKHPVLVRVRTTDIDRRVFTVEANQDDKLTFTATERARSDAKRFDENMLALFNPSDDGDILGAANQRFIQAFLKSLGDTEAAQYMTKDGKPTKALVDRIKAAVFSKAYNDDRLLEMMADDTKPEIQNVLNALGAASSKFIEAQAYGRASVEDTASAMIDGIEQSLDKRVVDAVVKATNTLLSAKANNQDIAEYVRQQGLFEDIDEGVAALAVFLSKNSRSAKRMAVAFKAMAEYVKNDALDQANIGLFGEPTPPSMIDVVNAANDELTRQYGDDTKGIGTLFDSALDGGMDSTELGAIYSVPVELINTDPKAYQWRTDVDENGLDGRDLDDFDQAEQAPILLHEREDGRMYVVDGHHRLAMAEGSGVTHVDAYMVREDDGYNVEDAKLLGQMLNRGDLVEKVQGLMGGVGFDSVDQAEMPIMLIESPKFERKAKGIITEYMLFDLEQMLRANPMRGDVIPHGRGIRKIRLGTDYAGKSGGARVIYYFANQHGIILLLDVYPKSAQANISASDLADFVKQIGEF